MLVVLVVKLLLLLLLLMCELLLLLLLLLVRELLLLLLMMGLRAGLHRWRWWQLTAERRRVRFDQIRLCLIVGERNWRWRSGVVKEGSQKMRDAERVGEFDRTLERDPKARWTQRSAGPLDRSAMHGDTEETHQVP